MAFLKAQRVSPRTLIELIFMGSSPRFSSSTLTGVSVLTSRLLKKIGVRLGHICGLAKQAAVEESV
jgi:hypothetical protein